MKRPFKPTANYRASLGIVDVDFTKDQLAGIGHVAMAYNKVEEELYHLFGLATGLEGRMLAEVFTRIGGTDGVAAIIIYGAEKAGFSTREMATLRETLGDGNGFAKYKTFRDAVIHARSFNAPAGVGIRVERRARIQEVLLTADALETLATHLVVLRYEIEHFGDLIVDRQQVSAQQPGDLDKALSEAAFLDWHVRFQDCRNRRLSLLPLPEFPAEAELLSAQGEWQAKLPSVRGWKPPGSFE